MPISFGRMDNLMELAMEKSYNIVMKFEAEVEEDRVSIQTDK